MPRAPADPPWAAPLEGESDDQFAAYCAYRDLPAPRYVAEVQRVTGLAADVDQMREWARAHRWRARAAGADRARARELDGAVAARRGEAREARDARLGTRLIEIAWAELDRLLRRPSGMRPRDVLRFVQAGRDLLGETGRGRGGAAALGDALRAHCTPEQIEAIRRELTNGD